MSRVEGLARKTAKRQAYLEERQVKTEAQTETTDSRLEQVVAQLRKKGVLD